MTGIVRSIAGHDTGTLYLVLGVENGRVLVCDGKHHKLGSAKRKNPKHLRFVAEAPERINGTDAELRKILAIIKNGSTALGEEGDQNGQ